jgi:dipeptidyl aminopeptidase/acylaminoacyl peptidase
MLRALPLVLLLLSMATPAAAQRVYAEGGNIFFQPVTGEARQLTTSGRDRDPSLSPAGRTVVFVRGTPGVTVAAGAGDAAEATELWTVDVEGTGARMLLRGRESPRPERVLARLRVPQFSPDGRTVFFLSAAWVVSDAVHAVDTRTGEERYVAPGNSLEVVPRGEYAGHLLVEQHRYFLGGGSYDWVWLLTAGGREVGPVGEDDESLEGFREMYVTSAPSPRRGGEHSLEGRDSGRQ